MLGQNIVLSLCVVILFPKGYFYILINWDFHNFMALYK